MTIYGSLAKQSSKKLESVSPEWAMEKSEELVPPAP